MIGQRQSVGMYVAINFPVHKIVKQESKRGQEAKAYTEQRRVNRVEPGNKSRRNRIGRNDQPQMGTGREAYTTQRH